MLSKLGGALKWIFTQGPASTARYAIRRIDSEYCSWRYGLVPALEAASVRVESDVLGLVDASYSSHIATDTAGFGAFRDIMRRYVRPRPGDVFLDYGSGAGKVLLMAATFPFRKIIGVEFSEDLCATAAGIIDGVRSGLRCREIEFVAADATRYDLPDEVTALYFFNPFWGDPLAEVLQRVGQSLERRPRSLRIVCSNPGNFAAAAAACGWLERPLDLHYPEFSHRFQVYANRPDPRA